MFDMNWLETLLHFQISPDVFLCGWLGLKHQLTNELTTFRLGFDQLLRETSGADNEIEYHIYEFS